MSYPLTNDDGGIKVKPELMEREKLYHCIFQEKIMLVFKDSQDVLNCYEIEEKELVEKAKNCNSDDEVEKIFEEYIANKDDLKN